MLRFLSGSFCVGFSILVWVEHFCFLTFSFLVSGAFREGFPESITLGVESCGRWLDTLGAREPS